MTSLLALIPIALVMVLIAGALFVWAVKSGQYDDLDAPALDILREDPKPDAETWSETRASDE